MTCPRRVGVVGVGPSYKGTDDTPNGRVAADVSATPPDTCDLRRSVENGGDMSRSPAITRRRRV